MRKDALTTGHAKSCGCLHKEIVAALNFKHGHARRGRNPSPTYASWMSMINRCENPEEWNFKYWGGKSIQICDHWHSFANFLADMGERPKGTTIDRYPNRDGNYEPGNCRWATSREQWENRTPLKRNSLGQFIKM